MKSKLTLLKGWVVFMAILMAVAQPSLAAEDALALFQKEIVMGKEKSREIMRKAEAMHLALNQTESKSPSLVISRSPQAAEKSHPKTEKSHQEKDLSPANRRGGFEMTVKKEKLPADASLGGRGNDRVKSALAVPITDGEALYKVAISDNKITLAEAVEIGVANHGALQAAKKKVEVARSKLNEARRAFFPTVQGVIEENAGESGEREYVGRSYKVNLTQPVYYGGELVLTAKQAEANLKSSQAEHNKLRNDTIHEIRTAFYGQVKAEYNLQYQSELYQESETLYKRILQEKTAKLISEVDFLNTESARYQIFFQWESAKNDLLAARLLLSHAAGMDAEKPLPVDLRLSFKKLAPALREALDLAYRQNPDLAVKALALESAGYGVEIFKAKKRPHVDFRGSIGKLGEVHVDTTAVEADNADLDLEKEWFVGLQTTMPIGPNSVEHSYVRHVYGPTVLALHGSDDWTHKFAFNLLDKLSDITDEKAARATYLQAKADYDKAKNDVTVGLREAFYNMQKSLIQIDLSVSRIRYQEKQTGVSKYLLGMQETSAAAFLEGLVELAQNRFAFIQAVTDYHLAVSSLNVATGDANYLESES
ncbi:MAG: TolC family protein [Candidatus Omnitrophica bacterium]|nr:TolC family protein [Candidatus Omnitrophota bacterium]